MPIQTPFLALPHNECGKCYRIVAERYRDVKCDVCCHFFHRKCSVKLAEFQTLSINNIGWTCGSCREAIFPFQNVESPLEFCQLFYDDPFKDMTLNVNKKCGNCCKRIKRNFPATFCHDCSNYFHIKCSDSPNKNFKCKKCSLSSLPFASIDKNSLLLTLQGVDNDCSLGNVPSFFHQKPPQQITGSEVFN